jgi:hypothetical protein
MRMERYCAQSPLEAGRDNRPCFASDKAHAAAVEGSGKLRF